MLTLAEAKNYMKVDEDLTEDDALIDTFIKASISYAEQMTGKVYDDSDTYKLLIMMMVANYYENRNIYTTKTFVNPIPYTADYLVRHISFCSDYKPKPIE